MLSVFPGHPLEIFLNGIKVLAEYMVLLKNDCRCLHMQNIMIMELSTMNDRLDITVRTKIS